MNREPTAKHEFFRPSAPLLHGAILVIFAVVCLLTSISESTAQTATAFGNVSASNAGLAQGKRLHNGGYCINYSGIDLRASQIIKSRLEGTRYFGYGPEPDPGIVATIPSDHWRELLQNYEKLEGEV